MDDRPNPDPFVHGRLPGGAGPSLGLARAFRNSLAGFAFVFRSERAFRQEAFVLVLALPAAFFVSDDPFRRALLLASLVAILVVELLNTAIEKVCDLVHPAPHPTIKAAKDMGSAAVLCAIAASGLLWAATLWQRLG